MYIYRKKQIYAHVVESPAWSITRGHHIVKVVTMITERAFFNKFHLFKTEQLFPICPFSDDNKQVKSCAAREKAVAIEWLKMYITKNQK